MSMLTFLRVVAIAVLASLAVATAAPVPAVATPPAYQSTGTFLQPYVAMNWDLGDWEDALQELKDTGNSLVIINWTAEGNDVNGIRTIYPTSLGGLTTDPRYEHDPIELALTAAENLGGMEIWLGLSYNFDWWKWNWQLNTVGGKAWLDAQYGISEAMVNELWANYSDHAALTGFYDVYETQNGSFQQSGPGTAQDNLASVYASLADTIHLSTGLTLAVAPFIYKFFPDGSAGLKYADAGTFPATPQTFTENSDAWVETWTNIFAVADIDYFIPQDSMGTGALNNTEALDWIAANREATDSTLGSGHVTALWADMETFHQTFWEPMSIKEIKQHAEAEGPLVDRILTFAEFHYQTSTMGHDLYHETYLDYLATGTVEANAPTNPTGLTVLKTTDDAAQLDWSDSTDDVGAMYLVFRDDTRVARVLDSKWTDPGPLAPGTTYTYKVVAFDAAGNESAFSSTVNATTRASDRELSGGRTYTSTTGADAYYPDSGGTELTDGVLASGGYSDSAWSGRWRAGNTPGTVSTTVDLGAMAPVDEVSIRYLKDDATGIVVPSASLWLSSDGVTYTPMGALHAKFQQTVADGTAVRFATILPDSTLARYVRIDTRMAQGTWAFSDEITVTQSAPNIAAGTSYTKAAPAHASYPDTGGTELTNGVLASTAYWDGAWQGTLASSTTATLDLGGSAGTYRQILLGFLRDDAASIVTPSAVTVRTSSDGITFTTVGSVTPVAPANQSRGEAVVTLTAPAGARYVQVLVASGGAWTFLDELQVLR